MSSYVNWNALIIINDYNIQSITVKDFPKIIFRLNLENLE